MEYLPPWLRNVPLPARPAGRSGPAAPAAGSAGGADEMPTWLRELQSEVADDSASSSAAPDWLADLEPRAADAEPPPANPDPFDAPAWLTDQGDDQPPPAQTPWPAGQDDQQPSTSSRIRMPIGATDWLRSMGHDPDARSEPLSEPISTPEDASGVPDWLRDLSDDEVARAIEAEATDSQPRFDPQVPGWLADDVPGPDASTVSANWMGKGPVDEAADQLPGWLQDSGESDVDEAQRGRHDQTPPSDLAGSAEVPAWLRELGGDEGEADDEPPVDDEPGWLRDAAIRPPTDRLVGSTDNLDVPAWLRDADAPAPAEPPPWPQEADAPAPSAAAADEMPSWLREAELPPGGAREPGPSGDVPDWLRGADEPAPPAGGEEVPSWLRDANSSPPPPASDDVPGWLRDDSPATSDPSWIRDALADPAAPSQADDVPAWLRAETPEAPPSPADAAPPPPAPSKDLPPWLIADDSPGGDGPADTPADPGLPSWLRGVADEPPAAPQPGAPPPPPPRRPAPVAEQGESNSFLSGAELPSWLRVPEPERPVDSSEGQTLDWLRRLGGSEQEEEPQIAAVAAAAVPQRPLYQRTAEQLASIGLLQRISQAPYPEPVTQAPPAPLTRWQRIGLDRLLYALLAIALLAALLAPALTTPFQTATPRAPGAAELGALLDGLGSEDVVLVAYEWGAQRSSELRPLEEAVIGRLVAKKTKLILVSTDLQGTLLSFDLIEPLRAAGYNTENNVNFGGRDYVLLGYRPGGELALRSMVQDLRGELSSDFDGQDATQSLVANLPDGTPRFTGISNLSMILVMADQSQDVQAWMEQVHPAARTVPMAFLLPQEAQPLVQPYLRLPNIYHLAGRQGALALVASGQAGDTTAVAHAMGQLWYAVAAFLVLLVVGAVAAAIARGRAARGGVA
ncbi:MAG: hypothetical protein HGA45_19585 [Chloroflexales bacterium]|nr:hypothetical protein [Chloroflexales bacterium]